MRKKSAVFLLLLNVVLLFVTATYYVATRNRGNLEAPANEFISEGMPLSSLLNKKCLSLVDDLKQGARYVAIIMIGDTLDNSAHEYWEAFLRCPSAENSHMALVLVPIKPTNELELRSRSGKNRGLVISDPDFAMRKKIPGCKGKGAVVADAVENRIKKIYLLALNPCVITELALRCFEE